jgi:hypothetical protein
LISTPPPYWQVATVKHFYDRKNIHVVFFFIVYGVVDWGLPDKKTYRLCFYDPTVISGAISGIAAGVLAAPQAHRPRGKPYPWSARIIKK